MTTSYGESIILFMDSKITKSNSLINASYRLSLNELRIVLYGLSFINPLEKEFKLGHRFSLCEMADFYQIPPVDRPSFYKQIKDALVKQFWKREFTHYCEHRKEMISRRWLIEISHGREDGTLAYHYNPLISKELQNLSGRFTSYFLSNVANMKSAYSIRIYELAIMYLNMSKKKKTTFEIRVIDLKKKLEVQHKYKNFADLKRFILERAKKDLSKFSDIKIRYEEKKISRKVDAIVFHVSKKENIIQPKDEPKVALPYESSIENKTLRIISPKTIEKAKQYCLDSRTGWDIYEIEQQFYDFMKRKGEPDNVDGAFIGFVKKKVAKAP